MVAMTLKSANWEAQKLLSRIDSSHFNATAERLQELESFFWFDLCAEYDAHHLHQRILNAGQPWTLEFKQFERLWYRDEINHFQGFRELYHKLFGESRESIDERLASRSADFSAVECFLADELALTVLFAYDELATTGAYHNDIALYRELNHPVLDEFIRRLVRDESYHFQNAAALIGSIHGRRLHEVPGLIADCVDHDLKGHGYSGTFIFDHEWDGYDASYFVNNGRRLARHLGVDNSLGGRHPQDKLVRAE